MNTSITKSKLNEQIGSFIFIKRLQSNFTQTRLAELMNVTFQQVQKYEKATNRIPSDTLLNLCQMMKWNVNDVYHPTEVLLELCRPTMRHESYIKALRKLGFPMPNVGKPMERQ